MDDFESNLKAKFPDLKYTLATDGGYVYHPVNNAEYEFNLPANESELFDEITLFLESIYIEGQALYRDGYYECLINATSNQHQYLINDTPVFAAPAGTDKRKVYFEMGEISPAFNSFLMSSLSNDIYSDEYYHSFKIYNIGMNKQEPDQAKRQNNYLQDCNYFSQCAFFDMHRKAGLALNKLDLSEHEDLTDNPDDTDFSNIKDSELAAERYDRDLLMYYNRASEMHNTEFKYIAYFQVLECIFDEVYLYETIQDARSVIDSSWFRVNEFDHVNQLIKIIDKYNKEQNDRSKTRLVLDKYFRLNQHDEAFLLANKEVIELLIRIKLIKVEADFKDLQKLAGIIYDIRNEYTHSNRTFPKKRENVVEHDELNAHIEIIRRIAETVILNYNRN